MVALGPEVLFGVFVAWHAFKLGVAGYLYFAYGEDFFAQCSDPEKAKHGEHDADEAVVVKGFATGDLEPGAGAPGLKNRRVTQLQGQGTL